MSDYCKVIIDSPLPQLGREFDYKVPSEMEIEIGQPVLVPFGRQAALKKAVVSELIPTSHHATAEIASVEGPPILSHPFISFIESVSKRQAITAGEMLRLSTTTKPKRKIDHDETIKLPSRQSLQSLGGELKLDRHLVQTVPAKQHLVAGSLHPQWAITALQSAISADGSAIINIADFRQQARLRRLTQVLGIESQFLWAEEYKTPAKRYFLQQKLLHHPSILVGTRVALMMDVVDLKRIVIVSDLDPSHESESAPYLSTRELAYLRTEATGGVVHTVSHVPSAESLRLAELGHVDSMLTSEVPRISFGLESSISTSKLIKDSLASGAVLVLTSFAGESASVICSSCRYPGRCNSCGGSLFMPRAETYKCRTCSQLTNPKCQHCQSTNFSKGKKGVSRTVADLGRMFPGTRIIESSQQMRVESVQARPLVVATPGAIPQNDNGYSLVVIDQPQSFLSRESLRALEHSLRNWLDAASFLATDGRLHFSDYEGEVIKQLSIGQITQLVDRESQQRKLLGLSPWKRLGIVEADQQRLNQVADAINGVVDVISTEPSLVFSYLYKNGAVVSEALMREQLKTPPLEGKRRKRGLKVVMDGQGLI